MSDNSKKGGQGPIYKDAEAAVWLNKFVPKKGPNEGKTVQVYNVSRETDDGAWRATLPTRINGTSITPQDAVELARGKPVTLEFGGEDRRYSADVAVREVVEKPWSKGDASGVNRSLDLGLAFHKTKRDTGEHYAFDISMPTKEEPKRTVTFFRNQGGSAGGTPAATIDAADAFKLARGETVVKGETRLELDRVEANKVDDKVYHTARVSTERIDLKVDNRIEAEVLDRGRGVDIEQGETAGVRP